MCLCDLAVELVIMYIQCPCSLIPDHGGGLGTSVTKANTQCKLVPTSRHFPRS